MVEQGKMLRGRRGGVSGKFSSSRLLSERKLKRRDVGGGKKKLFDEMDGEDAFREDVTIQAKSGVDGRVMESERTVVPLDVARKGVAEEDGYEVYYGSGSQNCEASEPGADKKQCGAVSNAYPLSYVEQDMDSERGDGSKAASEAEVVCCTNP